MSDQKQFIGTSQAAAMLQKTNRWVVNLCHKGKLEGAIQDRRNWRIPEDSVHAYMEAAGISNNAADTGGSLLPCSVGSTSYVEITSE